MFTFPVAMEMENNGHGIDIDFRQKNKAWPGSLFISGAGLPGLLFKVAHFHFHWGADSSRGSEHSINSIRLPMELHIVTFNTKYLTFDAALNSPDGLAVLAVMFTVTPSPNPALHTIVSNLPFVTLPDSDVDLDP